MQKRTIKYIAGQKEAKAYDKYLNSFGEYLGYNGVEKLILKRKGKRAAKLLAHIAWQEEIRSIGPNEGCNEWM